VVNENFIGTRSRRKISEKLKQKFDIFIVTKNIFKKKKHILILICLVYLKVELILPP